MAWITSPLAVVCLALTISLTSGLRCYVCNGAEFDSPHPQLSNIYKQINRQCNRTDDNLVTCPSPQPGNVVKCGTSTTQVEATSSGFDVSVVMTGRSCLETTANTTDGCNPADQGVTLPPPFSALGVTVNSFNITNCICSGDSCNNNNTTVEPPGSTAVPSVTGVRRPSAQPGLRCYVCTGTEFDSENPQLSNIYKQMNTKCNLSDDNLATCPSPQPGNVVKCGTSTTQMAATSSGFDVSVVMTDRSCLETTVDTADGCKPADQGVTLPPSFSALGVTVNSFNITNCICSGDSCNNNNTIVEPPGSTAVPSVTGVRRPSAQPGLRCYVCNGMEFDSPNPQLSNIYKQVSTQCHLTDDNLVTCPSPQPGNVVKCGTSTTQVEATASGFDVFAVATGRSCLETTADTADGCKPADQGVTLPPSLSALGVTVNSFNITNCICSADSCNNNNNNTVVPPGSTAVPSVTGVSRPSAQPGLRCYVCSSMEFDSPNPQLSNIYKQISTQCNLTDDKLVTCPSPLPGNVVKCGTSTAHMAATAQGYEVSGVMTTRRCLETTDTDDGCKDGNSTVPDGLIPPGVALNSLRVTDCFCSVDSCNNNDISAPDTTPIPRDIGTTRPTGRPGLQCYVCNGVEVYSTHPQLNNIFRQTNTQCNLTHDSLVTCPGPQPGNVVKCGTRTAHLEATAQGYEVSGVITGRRCLEIPADITDGCKGGNSTVASVPIPPGVEVNSLRVTDCLCSVDRCNNISAPDIRKIPGDIGTIRPTGKPGLRCYHCWDVLLTSTDPEQGRYLKDRNQVCKFTPDELVACPAPRPGHVVKCYSSTTHIHDASQGYEVSGVVTARRCLELTADTTDGCMDGNSTVPDVPIPPGLEVNSQRITDCLCSVDSCNNNISAPDTTPIPRDIGTTRPTGKPGLRCYHCWDVLLTSTDLEQGRYLKDWNQVCKFTPDEMMTCPVPRPGYVAKCATTTAQIEDAYKGQDVYGVVTGRSCSEMPDGEVDGCKVDDKDGAAQMLPSFLPHLDPTKHKAEGCYCSDNQCNNKEASFISTRNGQTSLKPALSVIGLLLASMLGAS